MSQEVKDFFATYSDFVTKVTSEPSLDIEALKKSMDEIESNSSIKKKSSFIAVVDLSLWLNPRLLLYVLLASKKNMIYKSVPSFK